MTWSKRFLTNPPFFSLLTRGLRVKSKAYVYDFNLRTMELTYTNAAGESSMNLFLFF